MRVGVPLCVCAPAVRGVVSRATCVVCDSLSDAARPWATTVSQDSFVEADPSLCAVLVGVAWAHTHHAAVTRMGRAGQAAAMLLSGAVKTASGALSTNHRTQSVVAYLDSQRVTPAARLPGDTPVYGPQPSDADHAGDTEVAPRELLVCLRGEVARTEHALPWPWPPGRLALALGALTHPLANERRLCAVIILVAQAKPCMPWQC